MTARERVLAAIAHREPDRVPLDIGSTPSSGISAIAYNNLKKHLGIRGGSTRIYDVVQQVAQPEEEILDRFGAECPFEGPPRGSIPPGSVPKDRRTEAGWRRTKKA